MPASKFVVIGGLVKKPELNGKCGSLVGGIDDGRYPVQVRDPQSNDLKTFKVKSENTTRVSLAELCKGLPHPVEIFEAQLAASSLQTVKPRLVAVHDRLKSLPQDDGHYLHVKDLVLCVELGLAKFATLSSAGFPAARVKELKDYFCRRVAEVTPRTSYLSDLVLVHGHRYPECCYHLCYTFATDYLIEYHHEKKGESEKVNKLCEEWLSYETQHQRAAASDALRSQNPWLPALGDYRKTFVKAQARALLALDKYEGAITRFEEVRRMVKQEEAQLRTLGLSAAGMDMMGLELVRDRASAELNLATARLAANKITRAEHKKALEEIKKYCPENTDTYRNILGSLLNNHGQKLNPAESGRTCRDTQCAICLESLAEGVRVLSCFHGFHAACHANYIKELTEKAAKAAVEQGEAPTNRAFCPTCRNEGRNTNDGRNFQKALDYCRDAALGRALIPMPVVS
eukprot:g1219.t1